MSSCVDVGGHVFISFCKQMGPAISVFSKTCYFFSDLKGSDKDGKRKDEEKVELLRNVEIGGGK